MTKTFTTLVATADLNGVSPQQLEAEVRAVCERLGVELVPCDWAPDPDTIADETGADRIEILDLNDVG